jgi:hypothetical protein
MKYCCHDLTLLKVTSLQERFRKELWYSLTLSDIGCNHLSKLFFWLTDNVGLQKMQTVLVTGANGFIGLNLVSSLVKSDEFDIIACVRSESKDLKCSTIEYGVDVRDISSIRTAFLKYKDSFVVHLASMMDFYPSDKGFDDPQFLMITRQKRNDFYQRRGNA